MHSRSLCLATALAAAGALSAQANTITGLNIRLLDTWALAQFQRAGTYPNGMGAMGAWTTCCNPGTVPIPFMAAMSPSHGFIHFLVGRESSGRFVQISDWSYVKHTFGSNNNNSVCGSCAGPGNFNFVEVGCSDTYANSQAVDHYWLGPPSEIDPWLGLWSPTCSHFDQGEPLAPPAQQCDGIRSFTSAQANALNAGVVHQCRVYDQDLVVANANFYWQAGYLVPAEAEANRTNNIGSRQFFPTWTGSSWSITDGPSLLPGSILQRWSGSTLNSNNNGVDDGRFYVAVKVTGPSNGVYHYEYAVHNRDNKRGMGAFRVPVCPQAVVSNFGFHDVDQDATNDWTGSVVGSEIVFSTTTNPLRWNSIFNFWFDCDASPITGTSVNCDQFDLGTGAASVAVASTVPTGLYNQDLGPGCGNPQSPTLFPVGTPDHATLGNASFTLRSTGNPASAICMYVISLADGSTILAPGCTLYSASTALVFGPMFTAADGAGTTNLPLSIPADPSLEGLHLDFQMANIQTGGAYLGSFNLSRGLRIRIGSALNSCP
jgi:hypothetical protein